MSILRQLLERTSSDMDREHLIKLARNSVGSDVVIKTPQDKLEVGSVVFVFENNRVVKIETLEAN